MMVFDICQTLVENMKDYSEPQKEYFEKNDMKSSSMWDKMKEEQKKKEEEVEALRLEEE